MYFGFRGLSVGRLPTYLIHCNVVANPTIRLYRPRPIRDALHQVMFARGDFVGSTVADLASSHPDAVLDMLTHTAVMFPITADGKVVSRRSKFVLWGPTPPAGIAHTFPDCSFAAPSAAAAAIHTQHTFTTFSMPFAAELPHALLDIIAAEPAGAVAHSYRLYIITVLMPIYRRVMEILNAHAAVVRDRLPAPLASHPLSRTLTHTDRTLSPSWHH